jgi:succinate dehydrogenase/fumarate reductase flavoprotein subunit
MTEQEETNNFKISRRNFMKGATAGAALVAGGALLNGAPLTAKALTGSAGLVGSNASPVGAQAAGALPAAVPTNWSQSADVVVVGYGGAGGIAAITAYDEGSSVLILEKTPSYASLGYTAANGARGGGGNTTMNAGNCIASSDPIRAAQYYYATGMGNTSMAVCQALAWMEIDAPAWCKQYGIKYTGGAGTPSTPTTTAAFANLPGATGFQSMSLSSGDIFFGELEALVQARNISVLFNAPATDLIQDPNTKEILGVKALLNNSEVLNIRANKGVILCTGSIEFNEAMKSDNLKPYPAHYYGWPFCTGDSVTMASKVGAAMWHMGARDDHIIAWFPTSPIAYSVSVGAHSIYVDKLGNRFANESLTSTVNFHLELMDYDITVPWYTRVPAFLISDSVGFATNFASGGGSTTLPTYLDSRPRFSNAMALANGWIMQGPDIPTLVATMNATTYVGISPDDNKKYFNGLHPLATARINMNSATLAATVTTWNAMVAAGKGDTMFGRAATAMAAISTPPYYAMPLWPGGPSTFGGPVRNEKGQVCDAYNNPIPRLYSAGENGSVDGFLGIGANNAQMIAFGRISATNAAAEKPWTT